MKKTVWKWFAAASVLMTVFVLFGSTVYADDDWDDISSTGDDNFVDWNDDWNTASGKCGDNLEWVLDHSNGALKISGSGDMWCRTSHGNDLWAVGEIKSVTFSGNIRSIGTGAFSGCVRLASIALPRSIKTIGEKAFEGCSSMTAVELVNTVESIGNNCFSGCGSLADVIFTGSRQDWLFLTEGVQTGVNSSVTIHYASTISVTSQPADVSVSAGAVANFSVNASGNGALKYQWYYRKKGVSVWSMWKKHTTAMTSAVSNDTWDGMQIYCRIQDSDNFVSSDVCRITLLSGVKINSQPSDVTVQSGEEASFTVEAEGNCLKYQWYYRKAGASGWSIWKAHTTATTTARANDTWDGMQVYCVVSDSSGAFSNSQPATIRLSGMPKILTNPSDVTVKSGDVAAFTVKAQGSNLKYQWYYMKRGAKCWSIWKAHTTATTTARANDTWDGMQVYCVVTDGFGSTVSSKPATIKLSK